MNALEREFITASKDFAEREVAEREAEEFRRGLSPSRLLHLRFSSTIFPSRYTTT